ncbi:MAG: TrkA C-terminal domain-containing protein [Acutalibacteraceae bacterium]
MFSVSLSVYIVGIILGNVKLRNKKGMVNFFDAITGLLQMLIFFILGLLSNPSQMPQILIPALFVFLFLTFVARPLATMGILSAFRSKLKQQLLVSWAGLRGATSIVFAILVIVSNTYIKNDFFNIVFCVVLLSMGIQGTLLPLVSKKLSMIDKDENVMKTFTDYSHESNVRFISVEISLSHKWVGQKIKNITLPPQTRIVLIKRNNEKVIPVGKTILQSGDTLILSTTGRKTDSDVNLKEIEIDSKNKWCGKRLCEIKFDDCIVVLIKRGNISFVPVGQTRLHERDTVVVIDE